MTDERGGNTDERVVEPRADVGGGPIEAREHGGLASPPPEVSPKPSTEAAKAKEVIKDNDRSRWGLGLASYVLGVGSFLYAAYWTLSSLEDALDEATNLRYQLLMMGEVDAVSELVVTQPMVILFVAKAVVLATVGSFAFAMLKTSEHLTMPLIRYLEFVAKTYEKSSEGARGETRTPDVVDALLARLDRLLDLLGSKKR